jgi:hypothetical protein
MEETPGGHRKDQAMTFNEIAMNDVTKVVGGTPTTATGFWNVNKQPLEKRRSGNYPLPEPTYFPIQNLLKI